MISERECILCEFFVHVSEIVLAFLCGVLPPNTHFLVCCQTHGRCLRFLFRSSSFEVDCACMAEGCGGGGGAVRFRVSQCVCVCGNGFKCHRRSVSDIVETMAETSDLHERYIGLLANECMCNILSLLITRHSYRRHHKWRVDVCVLYTCNNFKLKQIDRMQDLCYWEAGGQFRNMVIFGRNVNDYIINKL